LTNRLRSHILREAGKEMRGLEGERDWRRDIGGSGGSGDHQKREKKEEKGDIIAICKFSLSI